MTDVAKLMRLEILALANAVEDVAQGRYSPEELDHLAHGLDVLAAALRGERRPTIVDAERGSGSGGTTPR